MNLSLNWIAFTTIVRKEVIRFMRIWQQTLLPPVINQTLYFIIFGSFIGSQINDIQGVSYMAFIVPGLVMMSVITASYSNVTSSFFGSKFQKSIEELLVSPTSNATIIWGYTMGGVARGILVGSIVFGVSAFFTKPEIHNFLFIVIFVLLTSIVFSLAGLVNGIFARRFDDISIFTTFVLTPLTYFGGVFYSIQDLPQWGQTISKINPVLYMIDGFRYGFYGISDLPIWSSIGLLLVFMFGFLGLTHFLLKKGYGIRN
jgi:ABC-2 type transport system permease protein